MRRERLQNHVAGSVFTLPVCAVVACVMWWLPVFCPTLFPGWVQDPETGLGLGPQASQLPSLLAPLAKAIGNEQLLDRGLAFLLMVLATCLLVEMNNRNLLLRIRSRLVSSTWLVAAAGIPAVHLYSRGLVAAVCVAGALYMLFFTYQKRDCQTGTFHWALLVGVGSIFVPHVIAFLPFFLWYQLGFLRSMTLRSFCAALVGCLFPLCLWGGYWVIRSDYSEFINWYESLVSYELLAPENYLSFTIQQVASWGLITLLGLLGAIHYLNTSYNDRIQVRMLLYILTCHFFLVETFVCLQPQHLDTLMPMLMVLSAPLIAHFFTLTSSWFTNALFFLSVLAFGALGYLNLFMPLLRF